MDRITGAHLLSAMTAREVFNDNYVAVLETGSVDELQRYARDLSERIIPRGVETHEVVGIVLLLRDVLARSLFEKYRHDFDLLHQALDTYEPAANRVANTVRSNPLVGHYDVAPPIGDLVERGWSPAGRSSASLHLRCSAGQVTHTAA